MASGHVQQRGKKKGDPWLARWREYPRGPEHSKQFRTKTAAEEFLHATLTELRRGTFVDPSLGEVRFEEWAERWRSLQLHRPSTAKRVEGDLRNHVYPVLGDRPIGQIRRSDIQALVKRLGEKLSPNSVAVTYSFVASAFRAAVADRLIKESPCDRITLPKAPRSEVVPLTVEQVDAIAEAVNPRYRALILLAAGTGLRQGEACGLTVDRVEFLKRRIVVDRQRNPIAGSPDLFTELKTPASNRTIPLPETVGHALAEHLATYAPSEDGLIFTTTTGRPLQRNRVAQMWDRVRIAGIAPEWSSFHDLRHFYASLLIRHGCSVKVVQSRLGHSSAAETLDTYSHLWPDSDDETREAVDLVLGPIADLLRTKASG